MTLFRSSLLTLLMIVAAASPQWAQAPPAEDAAASADAAAPDPSQGADADAEAEPVAVPPELESARAAMRTFLEAFDPQKAPEGWHPLDRAAMTLDLSEIGADVRKQQGRELAAQLKDLLDRTELIDIDSLSARPDAEPWRLPVDLGAGADGPQADGPRQDIVLAPDDAGRWLFTRATVEAIPDLLAATRGLEIVEGTTRTGPLTLAQWLREKLPPSLLGVTFLLENWQWLGLMLLALVGFALDRLATGSVRLAIERYLRRSMEQIDSVELTKSLRPLGLLIAGFVWWLGLFWLGLPTQILETLTVAAKFVVIVASVWTVYRMVDIVAAVLEGRAARSENKFDDLLVPLFRKSAKLIVAAIGFVFIADNLNVDITSLIAGLGIGGLALALAAQDTVKNLFGSLTVILDQPFSVGDWVKIGDIEGTVVELGFRSTRIKTFYDSTITLPNASLISASVDNLGARTYRRWSTTLGLAYETPAEKVEAFCEGIRELVRKHPQTRKDSYQVYLNSFSAASSP
ncbi:MAG: mechanosensitive ion channel family protein, partial [Acidobacteriota bacterium]